MCNILYVSSSPRGGASYSNRVAARPRRIREEIVLAHVNRQPSKSAALPFPHRSHSSRGRQALVHGNGF